MIFNLKLGINKIFKWMKDEVIGLSNMQFGLELHNSGLYFLLNELL